MYDRTPVAVGIEKEFTYSSAQLLSMLKLFQQEIQKSNNNAPSSLKNDGFDLLPVTETEKGLVISLDFGGTGIRGFLIELLGHGSFRIIRKIRNCLRVKDDDYISEHSSAEQLFDFQAQLLATLTKDCPAVEIPMGYVFSYLVRQDALDQAVLIRWAKEIKTPGVEGAEVVGLLKQALIRQSIAEKIVPKVILNDTICTFIGASYIHKNTSIGSVIGTGFNSAYLEPNWMGTGKSKMVSLECGNFDKIEGNRYDKVLDDQSSFPGQQKLEKMVSGHYLGELFRLALIDMINKDKTRHEGHYRLLFEPYAIDAKELSIIIGDDTPTLDGIKQWAWDRLMISFESNECRLIKRLAETIAKRSACLIAVTYAAILSHIDTRGCRQHIIAINGSLYEKMPAYKKWLKESLLELLGDNSDRVRLELLKDGPALGAAVAAHIVDRL